VTLKTVAQEAGVSESYLLKHSELRDRIRSIAGESPSPARRSSQPSASALAATRTKLVILAERLKELEADVKYLRAENAALRGRFLNSDGLSDVLPNEASGGSGLGRLRDGGHEGSPQ
jgi:hypothetical protein